MYGFGLAPFPVFASGKNECFFSWGSPKKYHVILVVTFFSWEGVVHPTRGMGQHVLIRCCCLVTLIFPTVLAAGRRSPTDDLDQVWMWMSHPVPNHQTKLQLTPTETTSSRFTGLNVFFVCVWQHIKNHQHMAHASKKWNARFVRFQPGMDTVQKCLKIEASWREVSIKKWKLATLGANLWKNSIKNPSRVPEADIAWYSPWKINGWGTDEFPFGKVHVQGRWR